MTIHTDMIENPGHRNTIVAQTPRAAEFFLIACVISTVFLLLSTPQTPQVALYLFFLPVCLSGLFLGLYRSGLMALLCVLAVAAGYGSSTEMTRTLQLGDVLALCVWGAALGLTSIVTGSLSDERKQFFTQVCESHRQNTLTDALTEIANRRAFDYELTRRVAELNRLDSPFSLIFIDIDNFKKLNDTYGHRAGDAIIRGVAETLQESTRELDLVARFGGDEFAVLMPQSSCTLAKQAAERVRSKIEVSRFVFQDLRLRCTVSVGLTQAFPSDTAEEITERADVALYSSKQKGRNRTTFHNHSACEAVGVSASHSTSEETRDLVVETTSVDAYWDRETNLPSRRIFVDDLKRRVAEAQRHGTQISIALVEVGGGLTLHDAAPEVARKILTVVGELVCTTFRDADMVARYSVGQFAVSMPATSLSGARLAADRLQTMLSQAQVVKHNGAPVALQARVLTTELKPNEDALSLLERLQSTSVA